DPLDLGAGTNFTGILALDGLLHGRGLGPAHEDDLPVLVEQLGSCAGRGFHRADSLALRLASDPAGRPARGSLLRLAADARAVRSFEAAASAQRWKQAGASAAVPVPDRGDRRISPGLSRWRRRRWPEGRAPRCDQERPAGGGVAAPPPTAGSCRLQPEAAWPCAPRRALS